MIKLYTLIKIYSYLIYKNILAKNHFLNEVKYSF